MYFLRKLDCLFLNEKIHKEVMDKPVDLTKYIPISEEFFDFCLRKRSLGYQVYIKDNIPTITTEPCPSWYHSLDDDGEWIITEQKQKEKLVNELNDKLLKGKNDLEKIKIDLNYAFIMNKEKEICQLKKQAILIEKNIENIIKQLDKTNNDK